MLLEFLDCWEASEPPCRFSTRPIPRFPASITAPGTISTWNVSGFVNGGKSDLDGSAGNSLHSHLGSRAAARIRFYQGRGVHFSCFLFDSPQNRRLLFRLHA